MPSMKSAETGSKRQTRNTSQDLSCTAANAQSPIRKALPPSSDHQFLRPQHVVFPQNRQIVVVRHEDVLLAIPDDALDGHEGESKSALAKLTGRFAVAGHTLGVAEFQEVDLSDAPHETFLAGPGGIDQRHTLDARGVCKAVSDLAGRTGRRRVALSAVALDDERAGAVDEVEIPDRNGARGEGEAEALARPFSRSGVEGEHPHKAALARPGLVEQRLFEHGPEGAAVGREGETFEAPGPWQPPIVAGPCRDAQGRVI